MQSLNARKFVCCPVVLLALRAQSVEIIQCRLFYSILSRYQLSVLQHVHCSALSQHEYSLEAETLIEFVLAIISQLSSYADILKIP
jgi:hypothetical protein